MFSRSFIVAATVLAMSAAPAQVFALGGSNSGAPSAGAPTPTAPPAPGLGDVPACTVAPAEGATQVCGCAANAPGGSVWGTGPYTADSNVCTAARHAGAIGANGGVVRLEGLPGQSRYEGSAANGVTTSSWGAYGTSFSVEPVSGAGAPAMGADLPQCGKLPDGVDAYSCTCQASPAEASQSLWGSDPYTADSGICAAALHAGYLDAGEPGVANVLRVQGLDSYWGSENNGVTSQEWGSYGSSFVFDWNQ